MQLPASTIYLAAVPLALCAGPAAATAVFLATLVAAFGAPAWITADERQALGKFFSERFLPRTTQWGQTKVQEFFGTIP
jgi:hypothetical protein